MSPNTFSKVEVMIMDKVIEGTVIIMDLDEFEKITKEKGFDEYKPNIITGTLTYLIENFVRKWSAYVVYGLDYERGTEEVIIEIPLVRPEDVMEDVKRISETIKSLGASISIGMSYGPIIFMKARNRREAYSNPTIRLALKALQEAKRRGGGRIIVYG